jgi:hypothetical protein
MLKGKITISRPTYGGGKKAILIEVTDSLSRQRFVSVEMGYSDFAEAITGMGEVPVSFELRNPERVGLKKVSEDREVFAPERHCGRKDYEDWLRDNCQEEGWILNPYLGAQNSIVYRGNGRPMLRYSVYRYVKPEQLEGE